MNMQEMTTRVEILAFNDPMMGLAWEMEPVWQQLQAWYGENVVVRQVMRVLVDDVYRFCDPADLAQGREVALERYLPRLAATYRAEEAIGGMPIPMKECVLFSAERTTSEPLCLAYEAAKICDAGRADAFLYHLREATCAQCRPTTKRDELIEVACEAGLDKTAFGEALDSDEARGMLQQDMYLGDSFGITTLPAYVVHCGERALFLQTFSAQDFVQAIERVSDGQFLPNTN